MHIIFHFQETLWKGRKQQATNNESPLNRQQNEAKLAFSFHRGMEENHGRHTNTRQQCFQ